MTRNLKALGPALVAVLAMTAVAASGAQAQAIKVTTGSETAWLTGASIAGHPNIAGAAHHFTLAGGQTVTCEKVKFTATVTNEDTGITVVPDYQDCGIKVGQEKLPVTVTMNHCDYVLEEGVEVSSTTFKEGKVALVCPEGQQVEIHVYKSTTHTEVNELCTYKIAPFDFRAANEYHNNTGVSPDDVTVTTTLGGIPTTRTGSVICGAANTTATYTGSTTVKAFEDFGGTISEGTVTGLEEGNQVNLTVSK